MALCFPSRSTVGSSAAIVSTYVLSVALMVPAVCRADPPRRAVATDTEHIFGFTEGSDIGPKGEVELESTTVGRFGKVGDYSAIQNETAVRYGIADGLRISVGALFDYHSIANVPDVDDYAGFNFAGLTADARWQVLTRDNSPVGLTLSASPQWRRVDDHSGQPVESYSIAAGILADAMLVPNTTYAALNVFAAPTFTGTAGAWQQEAPLEASAAVAHAIAPGIFLGGEVRHLSHNHNGLFSGHALFVGPSLFVKMSETMAVKAAWSIQIPDETTGGLDLANYERHQVLLLLVKGF
jgi:hypothetical protein